MRAILFFSIYLALYSFTHARTERDLFRSHNEISRVPLSIQEVKDTTIIRYHKNGRISKRIRFFDQGQKEYTYYSNGQIYSIETYIEGRLTDTIQTYFHRNGSLLARGKTKNGARIGKWKYWYDSGLLKAKGKYSQDTKEICQGGFPDEHYYHIKIGKWSYWYESGQLKALGRYVIKIEQSIYGNIPEKIKTHAKDDNWAFWDKSGKPATEIELYKKGLFKEAYIFSSSGEIEP